MNLKKKKTMLLESFFFFGVFLKQNVLTSSPALPRTTPRTRPKEHAKQEIITAVNPMKWNKLHACTHILSLISFCDTMESRDTQTTIASTLIQQNRYFSTLSCHILKLRPITPCYFLHVTTKLNHFSRFQSKSMKHDRVILQISISRGVYAEFWCY